MLKLMPQDIQNFLKCDNLKDGEICTLDQSVCIYINETGKSNFVSCDLIKERKPYE